MKNIIDDEYKNIVKVVQELVDEKFLVPIESSGLNSMADPLYKRYRIVYEENSDTLEENVELMDELNGHLYFKINIDVYKQDLKLYKKHRYYVRLFSDFMKKNSNLLKIQCSINERSFEVFGDEKFLKEDSLAKEMFKAMDLDMNILNFYMAPEPFFFYKSTEKTPQNILIVENKDTFYTVRKLMLEGKQIFDMEFSTVIYGEGKKILRSLEDIYYNDNVSYINNAENNFYYWGDIDKEGIWIYQSLKEAYSSFNFKLLKEAYKKMLELSKIYGIHKNKKSQKVKIDRITELDSETEKAVLDIALKDNYIPQEIISYRRLIEK
ncbi:hypothetical protein JK636_04610 [Clostridium sp. YIM B02515]|uniref:Wadjet protein JetD C-terminal domain-containing protein n=1 Tax=Clostridium rhizosphaerae TaxID=2803861 RepID=A0ABS1T7D2_9CLOT|nr:Wadjet anti-phage system protein JetD domain-containing protein [Clostridium rhizosphaerae]MBL4935037.1 hypothetical protein [Clostridium rhizosphaerae]